MSLADYPKIEISLPDRQIVWLKLIAITKAKNALRNISVSEAYENGEAQVQILEGCMYEYRMEDGYSLQEIEGVVSTSKLVASTGRISPNNYVGTLIVGIVNKQSIRVGEFRIEVQSVKTSYRDDYRSMLADITEQCTDLLLQKNSPVIQNLIPDPDKNSKTLYQRFAFVKSILESEEFDLSILRILSSPVTKWAESEQVRNITRVRKIKSKEVKNIVREKNRIKLPDDHFLNKLPKSLPSKISTSYSKETVDTPENRFVGFALESYLSFVSQIKEITHPRERINSEAARLEDKLEQILSHPIFKETSTLESLPLNSPILQRKEGYREILRGWLMFDLAAKLIWQGGDDVYGGGKKNIALLYEYWVFFKLLNVIKEVFFVDSSSIDDLIQKTEDGLCLNLKQGKYTPIRGVYTSKERKLDIELSYNKIFKGDQEYPYGGSWSRQLRPDYTLSIWPHGIDPDEADKEELIVHIHFDAKYKVEDFSKVLGDVVDLDSERDEESKGTYKKADIYKMHTYRDAIRRSAGAYVLYPGPKEYTKKGFHEIVPGLGAFSLRPSNSYDDSEKLKRFLKDVLKHFLNRASQRERLSYSAYKVYNSELHDVPQALPESFRKNRNLIPDETTVLIAYFKNEAHLKWIESKGLYNARAQDKRGSLRLGPDETGARYLLLHSEGSLTAGKIYEIVEKEERGPRLFSKADLKKRKYPSDPSQDFYLVYDIKKVTDTEFIGATWDISKLEKFKSGRGSSLPFAVTLSVLMGVVQKKD